MLAAIAVIPSAPVLVPELAGAAAPELADARAAIAAAVGTLPQRWIVIGVGRDAGVFGPATVGTFAGYGADIPVQLSPEASGPVAELPLCVLMAGWVRGRFASESHAEVRVYSDAVEAGEAAAIGRDLRSELDAATEAVGVLIVADGAHTLTPAAPGGHDEDAVPVQAALDDALAAGDAAALSGFADIAVGRVAYRVLAGLGAPSAAEELYRGAPYGVGYFVGVWHPGPAR